MMVARRQINRPEDAVGRLNGCCAAIHRAMPSGIVQIGDDERARLGSGNI